MGLSSEEPRPRLVAGCWLQKHHIDHSGGKGDPKEQNGSLCVPDFLGNTIWLFNIAMENHHAIKNGVYHLFR